MGIDLISYAYAGTVALGGVIGYVKAGNFFFFFLYLLRNYILNLDKKVLIYYILKIDVGIRIIIIRNH